MSKKKVVKKPKRMTARQYIAALEDIGLTVAGKRTAQAFGIGLRQCQRIAAGGAGIPGPIEKLLALYKSHPEELPPPLEEQ